MAVNVTSHLVHAVIILKEGKVSLLLVHQALFTIYYNIVTA